MKHFAVLLSFKDADPNSNLADLSATILWGDGASSSGTIVPDGHGGYLVNGAHSYVEQGIYRVKVMISDTGGSTAAVVSTAWIADAPLTGTGKILCVKRNVGFSAFPIASFIDTDAMNTDPMDYVATINWGDGKSSAATFKMTGTGDWDILGDHKYTRRGKFTVSIKLKDYGGATTRIITTIYVV